MIQYDWCPYKKRERYREKRMAHKDTHTHTHTHTEGGHVAVETEMPVPQMQAQKHRGQLAATKSQEDASKSCPLKHSGENSPADTLILDL